jgi:hypothetical protein
MAENIFFLHHEHREGGSKSSGDVSKSNDWEVNLTLFELPTLALPSPSDADVTFVHLIDQVSMIVDLVRYLLAQGCYSKPKNIVVLTMYLGQLSKLRSALKNLTTVVIHERDESALPTLEDDAQLAIASTVHQESVISQVSPSLFEKKDLNRSCTDSKLI